MVQDGTIIFMGCLVKKLNNTLIYSRAIAIHHEPGRDDATAADLWLRGWKAKWPHYVRVDNSEFVGGNLANGVSLKELMNVLKVDSFASTQRNVRKGEGNRDPRRAYMRRVAAELSPQGGFFATVAATVSRHFSAGLRCERNTHSWVVRGHVCDAGHADARRLDNVDGVDANARSDVDRRRNVVRWDVGRDDGGDDDAVLGPNASLVPAGHWRDKGDAPRSADRARRRGILFRVDGIRNGRFSAGYRAGGCRDGTASAGSRCTACRRRRPVDRRTAPIHRMEGTSSLMLP